MNKEMKMNLHGSTRSTYIRISGEEGDFEAVTQFDGFDSYSAISFKAKNVFLLFRKIAEYYFPRRTDSRMRWMVFQELVDQYHSPDMYRFSIAYSFRRIEVIASKRLNAMQIAQDHIRATYASKDMYRSLRLVSVIKEA